MGIVAAMTGVLIAPLYIVCDEFLLNFTAWMPSVPVWISGGLIPVIGPAVFITAFYALLKKKYSASDNEAMQALFILLLVVFIVFTVTGIWFRGEGMALTWPWSTIPPAP
jgi:hypothetical protein